LRRHERHFDERVIGRFLPLEVAHGKFAQERGRTGVIAESERQASEDCRLTDSVVAKDKYESANVLNGGEVKRQIIEGANIPDCERLDVHGGSANAGGQK
jgi:hypothetical protein